MDKIVLSDIVTDIKNINTNIAGVQGSMPKNVSDLDFDIGVQAVSGPEINVPGTPTVKINVDKSKTKPEIKFTFDHLKGAQGVGATLDEATVMGWIDKKLENVSNFVTKNGNNQTITGENITFTKPVYFEKGAFDRNSSPGTGTGTNNSTVYDSRYLRLAKTENGQTVDDVVIFSQFTYFPNGAGGKNSTSDIRFKYNITPSKDVLEDVKKLELIDYDFNGEGGIFNDSFGVSAQQLEELGGNFKKMVHEQDDEFKTKWVEYDRLGVIALKAIQEQQKIIESLERRIKELENK